MEEFIKEDFDNTTKPSTKHNNVITSYSTEKRNSFNRNYDRDYNPSDDIESFPDLQNGPSSLIQGSLLHHQVGIHNFRLPLKYKTRDGDSITLETKVTGSVSLGAIKRN